MNEKYTNVLTILKQVRTKATFEKKKHFNAEARKVKWGHRLRLPVLILNIVTTSTLFSALNDLFKDGWQFVAAMSALASALFIGLSEYFKFEKDAGGHRVYGHRFAQVANRADNTILKIKDGLLKEEDITRIVDEVNEEYQQVLSSALEFSTNDDDYQLARKGFADGQESYTELEMA